MSERPDSYQPIADLLIRQTEILRKALAELSELQATLSTNHQDDLERIIGRLEQALQEDQAALLIMAVSGGRR
jgi:hypothetical protein